MASILKVDEMQGVTSAGDITITGEGGTGTMQCSRVCVKHGFRAIVMQARMTALI